MKLYNSLTNHIDNFLPSESTISIYSCGPTVYDNLHIGNLSAFIYTDILRRSLAANFPKKQIKHVMNITDVDDKTIRDSKNKDSNPMSALIKHTRHYEEVFMNDMSLVGNELNAMEFIRASDSIGDMQQLIKELYDHKIAYIADDGVYFSIDSYKSAGKKYGQLVHIDESSSSSRIQNDEYDKESAHDFALWKTAKEGEPNWEFELDGEILNGRPGWHIECSAMSKKLLGQPFDIHTGGIDLKFPHHENEIAQSTACTDSPVMAKIFLHNEHLLVDGTKMSKSLNNFYTLRDVEQKGFDPLAFRMLVLQGHYRNSVNFSWSNLEAAQNRLNHWRKLATLRHQIPTNYVSSKQIDITKSTIKLTQISSNDLNTPLLLAEIDELFDNISQYSKDKILDFTKFVDRLLGLKLLDHTPELDDNLRVLLNERLKARNIKDWAMSDELRDKLAESGIGIEDTANSQIWYYI